MKRILLTGTALASGMLFASVAQAQITVSLGGYTEFFAGFYEDDAPGRTDREFQLETEIVIRADGKADNGLLYGAKVELQNSTGGSSTSVGTDEASVYLGGTWGRLELGDFDGAADTLKIYAPVIGIEQIDGDAYDFLGAESDTGLSLGSQIAFGIHIPNSSDATKVMYLTPRFAGFQAGVSYAPESNSQGQNVVALEDVSLSYKDWIEGGINYTGAFGGFSVAAGATISTASGQGNPVIGTLEDFTAWNVGGQVGYAGFVLGGGYVEADDFNVPTGAVENDQSVWHIGVSYTAGPIAVGASYMDAEGYKGDSSTYASDYKSYGVGVAYTLAPGLVVQSDLMFVDEDVRPATAGPTFSNEGYVFVVGTRLDF
ncbi:porin [Skermanella mucosa]|uniref:porin n=1 Tax=Skermanella mucosa TaxID=1789672 RepID=UPI00192AFF05|nr:porin [Skermanella mucosa]UEM21077.1 porin [Skermanella mucosa]